MNSMNNEGRRELIILGRRIACLREKRGFTQEKLAELAGYSPNHISKLELARTNPSFDLLIKLADAFQIELKELFNFDEYISADYIKEKLHETIENSDENFLKILYKIQESLKG